MRKGHFWTAHCPKDIKFGLNNTITNPFIFGFWAIERALLRIKATMNHFAFRIWADPTFATKNPDLDLSIYLVARQNFLLKKFLIKLLCI